MEKAQQAIVANQERDGGNPNAFYKSYGCAASLIYDPKPSSIIKIEKAVARKLPITIAVSWVYTPNAKDKASKKGNHWLYAVGISGKSLFAKDQQNGHMMATINMDTWTGTAPGKSGVWSYTVTAVHIGCPTKDDWAAIYH